MHFIRLLLQILRPRGRISIFSPYFFIVANQLFYFPEPWHTSVIRAKEYGSTVFLSSLKVVQACYILDWKLQILFSMRAKKCWSEKPECKAAANQPNALLWVLWTSHGWICGGCSYHPWETGELEVGKKSVFSDCQLRQCLELVES